MSLNRIVKISLINFITFLLLSCGILNEVYKNNTRIMMVMLVNEIRLNKLETDISCYYKTNKKFPKNNHDLNNFLDSLNNNVYGDSLFLNLEFIFLSNHSIKYNFKFVPFTELIVSSPKEYNFDSIKVDKFVGKLIFNDSLINENKNKLVVKLEIDSLSASVYEDKDVVKCTEEDLHIFPNSPSERLLSIQNGCSK